MSLRTIAVVLGLATAALVGSGCAATSTTETPTAQTVQAATKAPFTVPAHGFVKASLDALGDVALRPDQRPQIEQLAKDAEARHVPVRQATEALMLAAADQVQAGTVDRAALQPKIDAVKAAMDAAKPADAAALEKLHSILDASQRGAFVDALKAKWHERRDDDRAAAGLGGTGSAPGTGGATAAHGGAGGGFGGGGMGFGPLKNLAAELKLTEDQQAKLRQAVFAQWSAGAGGQKGAPGAAPAGPGFGGGKRDWGGAKERITKMTDAFRSDHFVVAELEADHPAKDFMAEHGDRIFTLAATVLPILTPEQRTILATKIRDHAKTGDEP